jgi:asparagine synthase (glutamine-hydrolysing)
MCGIAGILTRNRDPGEIQSAVGRMTDALAHRGPDDAGVDLLSLGSGCQLGLGHRRLAIVDLSRRAHQPMHHPASGSWIVYNGEIYNHWELRKSLPDVAFRSTSDTETLLRGWIEFGPEWIRRLRGIFAFAIYDGRRNEFWLARDHLGVKPLYFARPEKDLWLFASEVRSLLASGLVERRTSAEGLSSYLAFGAVQAPATLVEGVRSLLPAERAGFDLAATGTPLEPRWSRYWQPGFRPSSNGRPSRKTSPGIDDDDFQRLKSVWEDGLAGQLLSDVPVGVFLSGGIDSSAIVATLARLGKRPQTFSVAFEEGDYDESKHARAVAERCGTEHHPLVVTPGEVLGQFDQALAAYDQPSVDGVNTYTISKAVRQADIKVALSGLGGDEGFAGYAGFRQLPRLEKWMRRSPHWTRQLLGAVAGPLVKPSGRTGKLFQILLQSRSRLELYGVLRQLFSPAMRARLAADQAAGKDALGIPNGGLLSEQAESIDAVNAVSLLELSLYMHNMLLRDTDQMSMSHALEVRVPLLDHLLIEELARLEGRQKLSTRKQPNKWLLVELAGDLLPREAAARRKMGFVFPWNRWLRGPLQSKVEEMLRDRTAVERAGLDPPTVASIWGRYLQGADGLRDSDVLALAHLVHWAQANSLSPPKGTAA